MKISRLCISDFRNIRNLQLVPHEQVNIFFGANAQGKTNLVEAVWLLTGAKSFRRVRSEKELVRFGACASRIEAEFFAQGRQQEIRLELGEKKTAWLNDIKQEAPSALAGSFSAVVFSPSHLSLVSAGPSMRRRFLDSCLCQISPKFLKTLSDYSRALTQRNALLKDVRYSAQLLDTLDVWDQSLAGLAALIIKMRVKLVEQLQEEAGKVYSGIANGHEGIQLSYQSSLGVPYTQEDFPGFCGQLYEKMKYHLSEDVKYGVTTLGAHRDDLLIQIEGKDSRSFASQGQSRSIVLSLKLAESEILTRASGSRPVVLLDDVMSELDASRREYLLNHIQDSQVFITCCEKAYFEGLKNGIIKEMAAGELL